MVYSVLPASWKIVSIFAKNHINLCRKCMQSLGKIDMIFGQNQCLWFPSKYSLWFPLWSVAEHGVVYGWRKHRLRRCRTKWKTRLRFSLLFIKGGSINYHRNFAWCWVIYVLSSCGLFSTQSVCSFSRIARYTLSLTNRLSSKIDSQSAKANL